MALRLNQVLKYYRMESSDYGNNFPIQTAKFESKIKEFVETIDNTFDSGIENSSTDNRANQRRKNKGGTRFKIRTK